MAWTLIAHTAKNGTSSGVTTSAVDTTASGGADLFVVVIAINSPDTSSVSDSAGNTYTLARSQSNPTSIGKIFYVASPTNSATLTFSVTGSNTFASAAFSAWKGSAASPLDQVNSNMVNLSASVTTGSVTPSQSNELLIAGLDFGANNVVSIDSGYTIVDQVNFAAGNAYGCALADLQQGAAAAVNATWSWSTTNADASGLVATFKQAAAAGAPTVVVEDPWLPYRRRFQPMRSADEQWPFTAVPTPTQMGWEWRPEFARPRFIPRSNADEQWPFTNVVTPAQFGWNNPEQFPLRIRFIPRSTIADEEWVFTSTPTPGQFGWDNPERFPFRRRFHPSRSADEEWPFTATLTPTQFAFGWEPQFPVRARFRTFQSSDEQWPFASLATPTQFGWDNPEHFPIRVRFRPLIYEPYNPMVPVVNTQFQTMVMTATKVKTAWGATELAIKLVGTGAFVVTQTQTAALFNEVLPFGSAHVVLTSGLAPTGVGLGVSNDGVNFTQIGPNLTTFPNIINLVATGSGSTLNYGSRPCKYHAWIVQGGDATTTLTITEIYVGWRG